MCPLEKHTWSHFVSLHVFDSGLLDNRISCLMFYTLFWCLSIWDWASCKGYLFLGAPRIDIFFKILDNTNKLIIIIMLKGLCTNYVHVLIAFLYWQ